MPWARTMGCSVGPMYGGPQPEEKEMIQAEKIRALRKARPKGPLYVRDVLNFIFSLPLNRFESDAPLPFESYYIRTALEK